MFQIIKNFKSYNSFTFFWLYLPILIFLILLVFKHFYTELFFNFFQGEYGLIENGTFAILFFSTLISFSTLNLIKQKIKKKNLFIIYFFFTLGLIYFGGEEINWGQHWFHWEANNFFDKYNDQYINDTSETNFHNISSWFDQKPRILLTIFVLVGGVFCPFFSKNSNKEKLKYWILPNIYCFPASIICLFFYLLDNSYKILCYGKPGIDITCKHIPVLLLFRTSEIIELYIALFLFIYIFSINLRLKKI